ncbi:MAG: methyltransferase domain-containing protein [Dehalococcoidia bacterium]
MPWDPKRYEQFKAQRAAPFEDLLRLIRVRDGLRVIDLGCGTGELTRRLADALPDSDVLGVDSSPDMLAQAAKLARPGLRFEQREIEAVEGEYDLVFSHAALQWVEDHRALVPKLLSLLRPGGQLAVQVPSNFDHPTHVLIDDIAAEAPFRDALDGWSTGWSRTPPVLPIYDYSELLYESGAEEITVFEKVYPHVLEDADALADWMSGTALVPYMERIREDAKEPFMERYRARLRERFPGSSVFFGFKRTLFSATKLE